MWNFSQSLWQDKLWLGQMMGDFFRRVAQRDTSRLTISHQEEADNACSNFEAVEGEAA